MPQDRIEGPTFRVGAAYFPSPGRDAQGRLTPSGPGIPAIVHAPFAVHFQQFDGPTDFVSDHSEYWFIKVYDVDIDLPWWVTAGLVVLGLTIPLAILPVSIVLGSILPTLLENAEASNLRTAQSGINGAVSETGVAVRRGKLSLPGFPKTPGTMETNLVSMTGEGFEIFASYSLATREVMRPDRNIEITVDGSAVQDGIGRVVGVVDAKPLVLTAKLKDGIVSPADPSVRVDWEVRRADTNAVLFQQDLPYSSRVLAGIGVAPPNPRRIVIDRTSAALMPIDQFLVTVRVYRPLSGRQKEFGSSRFKISVEDRFDRSHPFVHWNGWAGGGPKRSALHRTAAPGRCSMIMRAAHRAKFLYLDALPFPHAEINEHRKELCEYCFFGGPDKFVPLI